MKLSEANEIEHELEKLGYIAAVERGSSRDYYFVSVLGKLSTGR